MLYEKLENCPVCGKALTQHEYDAQVCGACNWPVTQKYVIALNDFAHEIYICQNEKQMHDRCEDLKREYLKQHPQVNPLSIRFHGRQVPTVRMEGL